MEFRGRLYPIQKCRNSWLLFKAHTLHHIYMTVVLQTREHVIWRIFFLVLSFFKDAKALDPNTNFWLESCLEPQTTCKHCSHPVRSSNAVCILVQSFKLWGSLVCSEVACNKCTMSSLSAGIVMVVCSFSHSREPCLDLWKDMHNSD
jgi:hypothetical protein